MTVPCTQSDPIARGWTLLQDAQQGTRPTERIPEGVPVCHFVRQGEAWKPVAPFTAYAQQSAVKSAWQWISKTSIDKDWVRDQYVTPPGLTVPEIARMPSGPDRRIDHALVVRQAAAGRSVAGMYWERSARVSTHHPADCVHAMVDLGPAAPGRPRVARGKIYWRQGTKDDLLAQWKREFSITGSAALPAR